MNETLKKLLVDNSDKIYSLLLAAYPGHQEIINYHKEHEVPFQEWFAFLFDGTKWTLEGPKTIKTKDVRVSQERYERVHNDFNGDDQGYNILMDNFDISKLGYLTVIEYEGSYRIVDGLHRLYACDYKDLLEVQVYEWVRKENDNVFIHDLKRLILEKLVKYDTK